MLPVVLHKNSPALPCFLGALGAIITLMGGQPPLITVATSSGRPVGIKLDRYPPVYWLPKY